jgi:hypothetical protein
MNDQEDMRFLKKTLQPCWPTLSSLHDCVHMACWVLGAAVQQWLQHGCQESGRCILDRTGRAPPCAPAELPIMPNPPVSTATSMHPFRNSSPRRMSAWLVTDVRSPFALSSAYFLACCERPAPTAAETKPTHS